MRAMVTPYLEGARRATDGGLAEALVESRLQGRYLAQPSARGVGP
jgi:hypothetical protein